MSEVEPIRLNDLRAVGRELERPECVLCTADCRVHVSNWRGGVTTLSANGVQEAVLARDSGIDLKPNGIALTQDGSYLLANLGDDGGVWRLQNDGSLLPFLTELDGVPLPPANFVLPDSKGRVWITVSTRVQPRADAYRPITRDGFVVLADDRGARIVADGLGYTNEVQTHPSGEWLYVNETFARRTSRYRITTDGSLGVRETVTTYGAGMFPDGMCFDEQGGLWVVSLVSNRVIRVTADGSQFTVLEDANAEHVAWVEQAFQDGTMNRPHFDTVRSQRLRSVSSIAFGGRERRICYLGCLLGDRIESFESPVAGAEPVHWHW
ncbi:MAG: SMP-30/gluconolactonase/LRE family protein [Pseudomonadota bacterium]